MFRDMNTKSAHNGISILKFQIGPVQEFIAQARSTRDLWSGSYLLSWLIAAGIRRLEIESHRGVRLVFPNLKEQPLLEPKRWPTLTDHRTLLTPNFTNIVVAIVPAGMDARAVADSVRSAISDAWKSIWTEVWKNQDFIEGRQRDRFEQQAKKFLSISWQLTPAGAAGYADAYQLNSTQLDAVRHTRDFQAWSAGTTATGIDCNKDSLSGREEAVAGGPGFLKRLAEQNPKSDYAYLFKHPDWLGAVAVVKRIWHQAYLKPKHGLKTSSRKTLDEFPIRSTRAIAAKTDGPDDEENVETAPGEKYFAVLAFDGDQIGRWLSGHYLAAKNTLESYHTKFSTALSSFALEEVRGIVEQAVAPSKKHGGFLVYAGGDDVLALLPAERALSCAHELRTAFQTATKAIEGQVLSADDPSGLPVGTPLRLDASVGIAIAHFKAPLQDVVRAAQAAEKRAKRQLGRSAVAVSLFKRSGGITEWGCQWEDGGLELHHAIGSALDNGELSAKFPHRAIELLECYRTGTSPLTSQAQTFTDSPAFAGLVDEIIRREFEHILSRQHGPAWPGPATADKFTNVENTGLLDLYLIRLGLKKPHGPDCSAQEKLNRVIGLLTAVAFAHRTRPAPETPTTGPVA